ncbi:unnamed protein product [Staurois parvus]|uniref:Uncharacterized protein n=1 Tax=Staurois parvus TaxID=386267 RepID=A0ABN9G1K3_9NEOB|nr:unnamed protein product [Staurois parvus]
MRGSRSTQCGDRRCGVSLGSQRITNQQKEPKMARSCDQLCPITADHISATCQCPSVPAVSAHPCHLPVPISATFQCLPVQINATYQCPSELPFSVTHQCQSLPPINASQCHLSVLPISATYQCQ